MNQEIIDLHVHFGAPKDEASGCYWSKRFEKTPAYYLMLLVTKSLFKKVDIKRVEKNIFSVINGAQKVNKVVLLALDQVYDAEGALHKEWTHLHVPNSYIINKTKENERILLGASVHPYRPDWQDELDNCLQNGAVLCKWIPSSQLIDPSQKKCLPFYKKLAKHHLPLLCHVGPEYTIPCEFKNYKEFDNPKYLRKALDEGVTVILAHCALPYFGDLDVNYQDDLQEFYKLFEETQRKDWQLYADLSALATPLRAKYIEDIKKKIPQNRLIFGSDYPLPASELSYAQTKKFFKWLKLIWDAIQIKNPLDKNFNIIKNMKFDEIIFNTASELISKIVY